jgi:hypothetical protein
MAIMPVGGWAYATLWIIFDPDDFGGNGVATIVTLRPPGKSIAPYIGVLIAPLRPYPLAPASDALAGGSKRNDFGSDRLRCRRERVEKQVSRQKPEVDRSSEHRDLFLHRVAWRLPERAAGTKAGCPQLSARGHPGAYGVVFALPLDQAPRRIQARADRATAKKRQGGRVLANVYEYTP